jgi:putative PEP-CTERM system TPR-repeat lipoprotein
MRALLAERDGKPDASRAALKEVTELLDPAPQDFIQYRPQLLMLNGLAHFGLNEREKAKPYLETFQRVQGTTAASKLLAQIYLQENNVARAIEVLELYTKAQPSDAQALILLASAQMAQGRNARAASLMQEALRAKDSPAFRAVLGLSFLNSGQLGNATTELEAAFSKDPSQTRAGAALAAMYLKSGQNAKAVQVAKVLVQREPGNPGLQDLLGMALAASGDRAGGRAAFERAVKLDGSMVQPALHLARMDIAAKQYDAALTRLNALLSANDKDVDVMLELALLSAQRGQGDEAKRWLEKANDNAGPREVRPGLGLADVLLRRGQALPSLEMARKMVLKAPDDVQAVMAVARAQLASGDRPGTRQTLTDATRLADFDAPLQVEIAGMQMAAGGADGASYSLEKALTSRPDFLPALAMMTSVELSQRDVAKAEKRARQITEQFPKRAVGYNLLGDVASARGQAAAAVDLYRKGHQIEPSTDTMLRVFRASWNQDAGKTSLVFGEQWTKAHPADMAARQALADGYARAGRYPAARAAYEDLLKTYPSDGSLLNNLANVLMLMKDPQAVAVAEKAVEKAPSDPNAIDTLGWILFQAGSADQQARALQLLRDARLRDPGNPVIRFHLATVLAKSGRKTEARAELDIAQKAGKDFEYASDVEKLLATLQ